MVLRTRFSASGVLGLRRDVLVHGLVVVVCNHSLASRADYGYCCIMCAAAPNARSYRIVELHQDDEPDTPIRIQEDAQQRSKGIQRLPITMRRLMAAESLPAGPVSPAPPQRAYQLKYSVAPSSAMFSQ